MDFLLNAFGEMTHFFCVKTTADALTSVGKGIGAGRKQGFAATLDEMLGGDVGGSGRKPRVTDSQPV